MQQQMNAMQLMAATGQAPAPTQPFLPIPMQQPYCPPSRAFQQQDGAFNNHSGSYNNQGGYKQQ